MEVGICTKENLSPTGHLGTQPMAAPDAAYGGIGYDGIYLEPNPLFGLVGGGDQYIAWATNVCDGTDNEVSANWSSSVQAVATINTNGYASFRSVGTSVITGTAKLQSVENPSCRPQVFQSTAPANVTPTISGPDTVWWFNGQNPSPANYPLSITLTAQCGSSGCSATPQWSVTQSDNKVQLSSTSGPQISVTSTGAYFSSSVGDISFTVSVNGVPSPVFKITSRTPWELQADPLDSNTDQDAATGYSTIVASTLNDQLASGMTAELAWNESVGTPQNANGSNWATCCGPLHTSGGTGPPLLDLLAPPALADNPIPAPTHNSPPSGTIAYMMATQNIYIGSDTSGAGVFVQQDTLTYYIDHGAYTGIIIPPKPPQ